MSDGSKRNQTTTTVGATRPRRGARRGKRTRGQKSFQLPRIHTSAQDRKAAGEGLDQATYIVFDIETTGGNPEKNGITEICALKVKGYKVVDRFYSMVNPETPIPPIVRKMTGITNQMVRNEPKIDKVMPNFVEFIGSGVLVSHNTIGDMKFLRFYSEQVLGQPIANFFLCTHLLVERLVSEAPNKSLRGLADFLNLKVSGDMHRADADAEVTLELFKVIVKRLKQKKIQLVEDGIRLQGDYESGMRLGWAIDKKQIESLPAEPGVFMLYNHSNKVHFVSSAFNLRRDVNKLLRYSQIPRPMLRLVLSSYKIDYKTAPSQLAALRLESAELAKRTIFHPSNWHQRVVSSVYLRPDRQVISAAIGTMAEGTLAAFGPVADRKEMKQLLDQVAAICGGQSEKRGVHFDKTYFPIVVAFFKGLITEVEVELRRQQNSLLGKLSTKFTGDKISPQLKVAKSLQRLGSPALRSLLEVSGFALVKSVSKEAHTDIYRIAGGRVVGHSQVAAEISDLENDEKFISRQRKVLARQEKKVSNRPLTKQESLAASATLWWIHANSTNREGKFIALSD